MLFNSLDFAIFLPIVFVLYWFVTDKRLHWQNLLIVVVSYVFYGWWDWRFLSLLFFSSSVDYWVGLVLEREQSPRKRKLYLWASLGTNLALLMFFKYYNFFVDNFVTAFTFFGINISARSLNIILPVGLSFYTFQSMSYGIDVYRRKLKPTKDFVTFLAFVSFFPQLVAGPIERATHLLPQFYIKRNFDYDKAVDGLRQALWGFFKKMVIADNCAVHADMIFNHSSEYTGSTLLLGAFFFAFQIYGDFSGYSDIAIGISRLFGFDLMKNFNFPYFSRDIAEFWRRWHISLSTWFRDYLYYPLGGSRGGVLKTIRNTLIVFLVSGFWHGANWTFVVWGLLNALYFMPLVLSHRNRIHIDGISPGRNLPTFREFLSIVCTFVLVVFAWIFFRAQDLSHALDFVGEIFSSSFFTIPQFEGQYQAVTTLILIVLFVCVEWLGRNEEYAIGKLGLTRGKPYRWAFYGFILFMIGMFMQSNETPFIYFQF